MGVQIIGDADDVAVVVAARVDVGVAEIQLIPNGGGRGGGAGRRRLDVVNVHVLDGGWLKTVVEGVVMHERQTPRGVDGTQASIRRVVRTIRHAETRVALGNRPPGATLNVIEYERRRHRSRWVPDGKGRAVQVVGVAGVSGDAVGRALVEQRAAHGVVGPGFRARLVRHARAAADAVGDG